MVISTTSDEICGSCSEPEYNHPIVGCQGFRSLYYWCMHCGKKAFKKEWGPGWNTCPHCKLKPLTPAQLDEKGAVCYRCEWVWRDCSCGRLGPLIVKPENFDALQGFCKNNSGVPTERPPEETTRVPTGPAAERIQTVLTEFQESLGPPDLELQREADLILEALGPPPKK